MPFSKAVTRVSGVASSSAGTFGGICAGTCGAIDETPGDMGRCCSVWTWVAVGEDCGGGAAAVCVGSWPRMACATVWVISGGSVARGYSKLL